MEMKELVRMVKEMRAVQKEYFSTYDRGALRLAKRLEKEVDAAIAAHERGLGGSQQSLFARSE